MFVVGAACSGQDPVAVPDPGDGFAIRQHDDTTFDATVTSGGATLRLQVQQVERDVVDVTFDFGDPVIGFHIDYTAGLGEFQPSGAPLDAAQSRLVDALLAELGKMPSMVAADHSRVDDVTYRVTSLMQIVPTGEALAAHPIVAAQGWTHISCSCFNQYLGNGQYRICGKGSGCTGGSGNGCKGRCGTGCSPCVGTAAYTRDCGRHDWGIGSFASASDDFMFASNNCGC
ncbi:MAG: hypothetical protein JNL83_38095 [Myxococcales bacterium]|nr:hypothetical protein [Myxococcales bacterium]